MGNDASNGKSSLIKIWATLVVMLIINVVVSKLTGILVITIVLATAMAGIALAYFMHLNVEKKMVWAVMTASVIAIVGLFVGMAPDILKNDGINWEKCNSFNEKNLERFAGHSHGGHESPYAGHTAKIGLDKNGSVCTPQRF
jgi:heme/copper-type cytochrome/quinol oxidase subunit 4